MNHLNGKSPAEANRFVIESKMSSTTHDDTPSKCDSPNAVFAESRRVGSLLHPSCELVGVGRLAKADEIDGAVNDENCTITNLRAKAGELPEAVMLSNGELLWGDAREWYNNEPTLGGLVDDD